MLLVGLTGGIGSGKSTVAGLFQTMGISVYDSDLRAKILMNDNVALKTSLQVLFGAEAYLPDGSLNRSGIAARVFNNPKLLKQLNAIVHPAVYQDLLSWSREDIQVTAPYLIQESAILFEENLTDRLISIILVVAEEDTRIERVLKRDNITRENILQRINNQWSDKDKIPLSDYIIYNDGDRSLVEQVMDIHQMILASLESFQSPATP